MSVPPPPDRWGSQPPTGWSAPRGAAGQPPGAGQPGGVPPWGAQQPWSAPPGPPPHGGRGKWILAGIAALAVIAVTAVITALVVRPDSGDNSPTPGEKFRFGIASADDKGPVSIITEDPTCAAWNRVGDGVSAPEKEVDGVIGNRSVPASAWTPGSAVCMKRWECDAHDRRSDGGLADGLRIG